MQRKESILSKTTQDICELPYLKVYVLGEPYEVANKKNPLINPDMLAIERTLKISNVLTCFFNLDHIREFLTNYEKINAIQLQNSAHNIEFESVSHAQTKKYYFIFTLLISKELLSKKTTISQLNSHSGLKENHKLIHYDVIQIKPSDILLVGNVSYYKDFSQILDKKYFQLGFSINDSAYVKAWAKDEKSLQEKVNSMIDVYLSNPSMLLREEDISLANDLKLELSGKSRRNAQISKNPKEFKIIPQKKNATFLFSLVYGTLFKNSLKSNPIPDEFYHSEFGIMLSVLYHALDIERQNEFVETIHGFIAIMPLAKMVIDYAEDYSQGLSYRYSLC